MNRLQKKCFVASTGLHLLLGLILLVGPAFVASKSKRDNIADLNFIPLKTVDALISGGGNPNAKPPPAPIAEPEPLPPAPIVQAPPPPPEKVKEPDPPKDVVKEPTPSKAPEFSFEPARKEKPKKPSFEFTVVKQPTRDLKAEAKAKADAEAREQERLYAKAEADKRRRAAAVVGNAVKSLEEGRSGSTTLELIGPGGGGLPYANFLAGVKTVYENAWIVPDGITDENATAVASVTIARDGRVVSAHITRSSANAGVDRSVQVTLDRVKKAVPLPDEAKEDHRTVEIKFNVAARRALG